jgi:hypothetical protein
VTALHLPIYAGAGAVLAVNFMSSLVGMMFYSTIPLTNGATSAPAFILGFLFGAGGLTDMHVSAKIPETFACVFNQTNTAGCNSLGICKI